MLFDDIIPELKTKTGRDHINHLLVSLISLFENDEQAASQFIEKYAQAETYDIQDKADIHAGLAFAYFYEEMDDLVNGHVVEAVSLLRSIGEDQQAPQILAILGQRYLLYQQPQIALQYFHEVCAIFEERKDDLRLARALNNTGRAFMDLGEFRKALPFFKRSVELNTKRNNKDLVNSYNNLASIYFRIGMLELAFKYYKQALEASNRFDFNEILPHIYSNIATINSQLKSHDEAVKYYNLALSLLSDSVEDRKVKANVLNDLGRMIKSLGRYDEADELLRQAIDISRSNRFTSLHAHSLHNLGNGLLERERFAEASEILKQARELYMEVGDNHSLLSVLMSLVSTSIGINEMKKAASLLETCNELAETHGDTQQRTYLHDLYAKYYAASGEVDKQLHHLQKLVSLQEKELEETYPQKLAVMQTVFDLEQKEKEAEIHRLKSVELKKKNDEILRQKEQLETTLEELRKSEIGYEYLNREIKDLLGSAIIGDSEQIQGICSLIHLVAKAPDTSVLITGETGTGKELVARAIHDISDRRRKNFCAVNISSISESLFESEFFGYRKNAFTGADRDKPGWFEIADGGTLFLDEIGTWRQSMQAKFLRVLENRTIIPVGADRETPIDIRVISATNDDLQSMLDDDRFRADLYYRLSSFVIHIPPLRERTGDIPLLLEHFVKHFNEVMNKKVVRIQKQLEEQLGHYAFPGNVREMKNMVERAMIMCQGSMLKLEHFTIPSESNDDIVVTLDEHERRLVLQALKRTGFHQAKAARLLGITPKSMERRVKKFDITREEVLPATKSS